MQLVLQLTRNCNFACTYCYQRHTAGQGMTPDVVRRAVEFAARQGHEHVAVTYFGGEPLLEREVITATLPGLRDIGAPHGTLVTAKISTNGALLDEEFCNFARSHQLFVSLSADGHPDAQDRDRPVCDGRPSSGLVEAALSALTRTRTPFATYSVVHPRNVALLSKSVDWLFERGARVLVSTLDFGADWQPRDHALLERGYRDLVRRYIRWSRQGVDFYLAPFDGKITAHTQRRSMREHRCAAGVRQVAVDPEGFIYPCIEFLEDPKFRIGHIDSGIDRQAVAALRHDSGGERPEACGGCGIRSRCGSTCACLNLRTAGSMRGVNELLCAHERMVTQAADRIGATLWKKKVPAFLRRQSDPHHHALSALESLVHEAKTP